jgi:preprotein translocase subunit YajC
MQLGLYQKTLFVALFCMYYLCLKLQQKACKHVCRIMWDVIAEPPKVCLIGGDIGTLTAKCYSYCMTVGIFE